MTDFVFFISMVILATFVIYSGLIIYEHIIKPSIKTNDISEKFKNDE